VHTKPGVGSGNLFNESLLNLAKGSSFESVRLFVVKQANARNTLLYASDASVPLSKATRDDLASRQRTGLIMLVVSVMILQVRGHQALVSEAISAFLGVIGKLPKEEVNQ
jgi:hypothetical protein